MTSFSDPNTIAHTAHWRESSMNCVKYWTKHLEWMHWRLYHVTRTPNIEPIMFLTWMYACMCMCMCIWLRHDERVSEQMTEWFVWKGNKRQGNHWSVLFSGLCQCVFCILFIIALCTLRYSYCILHMHFNMHEEKATKCQYQLKP